MILVGSVAMTKFQQQYEASILRTLGTNAGTVRRMVLLEWVPLTAAEVSVVGLVTTGDISRESLYRYCRREYVPAAAGRLKNRRPPK